VPSVFTVEVGKPYILQVNAKEDGIGCMSTIMIPGVYKTPLLITKGMISLPFTINRVGSYPITCAMGVHRGTINAVKAGA
jgi:plastocyanin domain-containing protein